MRNLDTLECGAQKCAAHSLDRLTHERPACERPTRGRCSVGVATAARYRANVTGNSARADGLHPSRALGLDSTGDAFRWSGQTFTGHPAVAMVSRQQPTDGEHMMQSDIQNVLSGLLADWHWYSVRTAPRAGLPGKAACFGQSRSNSQFDWELGIESDLVDKRIMQGFDAAIQRVPQPFLTALQFEARNLAVRYQVWVSPRLPANRVEREALILDARNRLLKELARDGVLC